MNGSRQLGGSWRIFGRIMKEWGWSVWLWGNHSIRFKEEDHATLLPKNWETRPTTSIKKKLPIPMRRHWNASGYVFTTQERSSSVAVISLPQERQTVISAGERGELAPTADITLCYQYCRGSKLRIACLLQLIISSGFSFMAEQYLKYFMSPRRGRLTFGVLFPIGFLCFLSFPYCYHIFNVY